MFNWVFRTGKKNPDDFDALQIPILDRYLGIERLYFKLANFYHFLLFSKLVNILDTVYGKYDDIFNFLPPSDLLNDMYQNVKSSWDRIDKREDFSSLKIMDFKAWPDLYGNHHERIKLWKNLSKDYFEDIKLLKKRVIQEYPISNDVRVAFVDIDKLSNEHGASRSKISNKKSKQLDNKDIFIDEERGLLIFGDLKKDISIENKEYKFFLLLQKNKGKIVKNKEMAYLLGWKPFDYETDRDFSQKLKDLKQSLGDSLIKIGINEDAVKRFKNRIMANRGLGYKLS